MCHARANAHLFDNHLLLTCPSATFLSDSDLGVVWCSASTHNTHPRSSRTTASRVMRQLGSIFNFNDNSLATCCPTTTTTTTRAATKLMDKKKPSKNSLELGRTYGRQHILCLFLPLRLSPILSPACAGVSINFCCFKKVSCN